MSKNYEWYVKADTSKYAGKWIAIVKQKVSVSGCDAKKVYEKAKKRHPKENISLAKVPPAVISVLITS